MNQHIQAAASMMGAQPAEDSDARHEQNVAKAKDHALFVFYSKESHDKLMSMIQEGDEAGGAAIVAVSLIEAVDEKSGGNMPDDVILPAALEVMSDIMDFLEQKKGIAFTDKEHSGAIAALMKKLADDYGTTPDQMKEALAGLSQEDIGQANDTFMQATGGQQASVNQP